MKVHRTADELDAGPFKTGRDVCLSFWALAWEQGWIDFPQGAKVLEIGCAEADWQTPMLALRPDLDIWGIDWRECKRPGTTVCQDVMVLDTFPHASFDAVVSISAIEHVGLGAYDDDPAMVNGDTVTMVNANYWLKPGGWMYLDVPYRPTYEAHRAYRGYDDEAIAKRLLVNGRFKVRQYAKCEVDHPDSPYIALLLDKA